MPDFTNVYGWNIQSLPNLEADANPPSRFLGATVPHVVTLLDAATIATDASLGNEFRVTISNSRTMGAPSNPMDGQIIRYHITQGTGGSFTVTWNAVFDFGAAGAPTLSTTAGLMDIVGFAYDSSLSKWCCAGYSLGF